MHRMAERHLLILPALLYMLCIPCEAQQRKVTGRVIDAGMKIPVAFAHIQNYSRRVSTFTDTTGYFSMEISPGDTLVLSAVGYFYSKVIAGDSLLASDAIPVLTLRPRSYDIAEAYIYLPRSYEQFKQSVRDLDMQSTRIDTLRGELRAVSRSESVAAYEEFLANRRKDGITLLSVPIRTRDERERLELRRILDNRQKQDKVYEKFNPGIVRMVTGLTDEDEIIAFMIFCDFDEDYVIGESQINLIEKIEEKFREYRKKNK